MGKYLGTQIAFRSTMMPSNYTGNSFKRFNDVKKIEKKVFKISRAEVMGKTSLSTTKNIIKHVNKFFEDKDQTSFGIIKYIESNIIGNNTLKDVEPMILVSVYIHYKQNKISQNKETTK